MAGERNILGICGAPCTGKTTLARWLRRKLDSLSLDCELLPELARILKERGVAIDKEMQRRDYDAFLAAYVERDSAAGARIAIADRTPVDHCSYLQVNRNIPAEFINRHEQLALAALGRYRLLVYLPVQFPICDDGFRETSLEYQQGLDAAIGGLLTKVEVPVVIIRAERRRRQRLLYAEVQACWPELFNRQAAAGAGG